MPHEPDGDAGGQQQQRADEGDLSPALLRPQPRRHGGRGCGHGAQPQRARPRLGRRRVRRGASGVGILRLAGTPPVLTWYSGGRPLGTGERVSAGRQVLRLVARDGAGRRSVARRTIRVAAPPLRIRALRYRARVGVATRTVSLRIRTSAAATLRLGGRRYAVGPDAERIAVRLPALPATGLLRVPFRLSPHDPDRTVQAALEILRLEDAS